MALAYEAEDDPLESPPLRMPRDLCDKKGAEWIRDRIDEYWNERGYLSPQFELRQQEFHPAVRSGRYDVRSDIKNGFPQKKKPAAVK